MKVLFIASAKTDGQAGTVVKQQADSLTKCGINVSFFCITGNGIRGYLFSIYKLRKHLKKNKYDIFHVHYLYSALAAAFAGIRPLVVSLMGSDVKARKVYKYIIRLMNLFFFDHIIVKSAEMKDHLGLKDISIIPNGVDLQLFKEMPASGLYEKYKFNPLHKHILFISNPERKEKNFDLAKAAVERLGRTDVELHAIYDVLHIHIPEYMAIGDVLLLTSFWEGSPNVVKEAMACGLPVVSTRTGDVEELIEGIDGCYISGFELNDIAENLGKALKFNKRTDGRKKVKNLDNNIIAHRIISVYDQIKH